VFYCCNTPLPPSRGDIYLSLRGTFSPLEGGRGGPLIQNQFLYISKVIISGGNDLISGLQAFQNFIILGVLAAEPYFLLVGTLAVFTYLEYPVTTGFLEKSAFGQEQCLFFLAERQANL